MGGLIGLGGAEFRLPVLTAALGQPVREAVPTNLLISLFTLLAALVFRSGSLSPGAVQPWLDVVGTLVLGSVVAAYLGTAWLARVSSTRLHRTILALLVGIGILLVLEGALGDRLPSVHVDRPLARIAVGLFAGLVIGAVSSMLGVAGGELIIPTLLFVFDVDIKTAGTASVIISIPMVVVGSVRYARQGLYRRAALAHVVVPMAVGSLLGAAAGGLLVGVVEPTVLKIALGGILIVSAVRVFRGAARHERPAAAPSPPEDRRTGPL